MRVWDYENEVMLYEEMHDFFIYDKVLNNDVVNDLKRVKNYKVMNSTGLVDKKGKIIYEHDLLINKNNGSIEEVILNKGCYMIGNKTLYSVIDKMVYIGNSFETNEALQYLAFYSHFKDSKQKEVKQVLNDIQDRIKSTHDNSLVTMDVFNSLSFANKLLESR